MQVTVFHLSDIHLRDKVNIIDDRINALCSSIRSNAESTDAALLIVTGDIAFSGKKAEYAVAETYFRSMRDALSSKLLGIGTPLIFLPGNHDCDFTANSRVRDSILTHANLQLEADDNSDWSIIEACTKVQDSFYDFAMAMESTPGQFSVSDRLRREILLTIGTYSIRIDCYNTAWMSSLHEAQGRLIFPVGRIAKPSREPDLVIAACHHPYNWLEATNAKAFQRLIEDSADILLTGHEHDGGAYVKAPRGYSSTVFIEGDVLQDEQNNQSGYNIIDVKLADRAYRTRLVAWSANSGLYGTTSEESWQSLSEAVQTRRKHFTNTDQFQSFLSEPGAAFTHPMVGQLTLRDIFVHPDLEIRQFDSTRRDGKTDSFNSSNLGDKLLGASSILVGPEQCGRSTLLKVMYQDLQSRDCVPVLLRAEQVKDSDPEGLRKTLMARFDEQYGSYNRLEFEQLPAARRAVLIDDFHLFPRTPLGMAKLLKSLSAFAETLVFTANDSLPLEELIRSGTGAAELLQFTHYYIRRFGHARRSDLIDRWSRLGSALSEDEEGLQRTIDDRKRLVDTVLGRNLLPPFPLFILHILQQIEAQTNLETAPCSYGYIYESLILSLLLPLPKMPTLDTRFTVLAQLAFRLYSTNSTSFDAADFEEVCTEYHTSYRIALEPGRLLRELETIRLFRKVGDSYQFRYRYVFYYFTAKYIKSNLTDDSHRESLKARLGHMVERLHSEANANILMFVIYLTSDAGLIRQMIGHARTLFAEYGPCDMTDDVKFLNVSTSRKQVVEAVDGDIANKRRERHQSQDEIEDCQEEDDDGEWYHEGEVVDAELDDVLLVNVAFKNLQILGQVMRNAPGSLQGDLKRDITVNCYELGLRVLSFFFEVMQRHEREFREVFRRLVREKYPKMEEALIIGKVDVMYHSIGCYLAYVIVKRVSYAVGSEPLVETYKETLEHLGPKVSALLIDMSIRLDHLRPMPALAIMRLYGEFGKDKRELGQLLLRMLVIDYMHLFEVEYKTKQKLCKKLGVELKPLLLHRGSEDKG